MYDWTPSRTVPEFKQMIAEASRALSCLDAERLEELAACCQALNRHLPPRTELARQTREAAPAMETFARVLEATQSNLSVMRRLRELRQGTAVYEVPKEARHWAGEGHGEH